MEGSQAPVDELQKHLLEQKLQQYGLPLEDWGKGDAKTVDALLEEIMAGETELIETKEGTLFRQLRVVRVDVFYREGDIQRKLRETKQKFFDGRVRIPQRPSSLSEKMLRSETPQSAFQRAMLQELHQITEKLGDNGEWVKTLQFSAPLYLEESRKSKSYPGLMTHYAMHIVSVFLSSDHYIPDGYTEERDGKTNTFEWEISTP